MTQKEAIYNYMLTHDWITPMEAFAELGVTKLATQISLMIREGVPIRKQNVTIKNRYGYHTTFTKYALEVPDGRGEVD